MHSQIKALRVGDPGRILLQSVLAALALSIIGMSVNATAAEVPASWKSEWPDTDFSTAKIDLGEIMSGGPPKDGIPAIDEPRFRDASQVEQLSAREPVIVLTHDGQAKAYPLRILIWHEIVNDEIGGRPVTVTYCPLCNTAIVFDRQLDGRTLDFGVSGKLHHSDMIMYDRQTESWWQQFTGEAVVGEMVGKQLTMLPSNVLPFESFAKKFPDGKVLRPAENVSRPYGVNPYESYDTSARPFLYSGDYDRTIPPLTYVIAVGDQAWPLALLREKGEISARPLRLRWKSGMSSALDTRQISEGRDLGYVEVTDVSGSEEKSVPFVTTFAFAFDAFHPDGTIHGTGS